MQEIKFRVLSEGKWYYATLDEIVNNLGWEYGIPDNVSAFIEGKHKTQFTGFKDSRGQDIYEGDVIRRYVTREEDTAEQIFEITFNQEYAEFEAKTKGGWTPVLKYILESGAEIIGNIYENKELISK